MADEPFIMMRRGADLLGLTFNDNGCPVVTYGCDCGHLTSIVLEDVGAVPNGTIEVAYTCDGCTTPHWLTFTVWERDADD